MLPIIVPGAKLHPDFQVRRRLRGMVMLSSYSARVRRYSDNVCKWLLCRDNYTEGSRDHRLGDVQCVTVLITCSTVC